MTLGNTDRERRAREAERAHRNHIRALVVFCGLLGLYVGFNRPDDLRFLLGTVGEWVARLTAGG